MEKKKQTVIVHPESLVIGNLFPATWMLLKGPCPAALAPSVTSLSELTLGPQGTEAVQSQDHVLQPFHSTGGGTGVQASPTCDLDRHSFLQLPHLSTRSLLPRQILTCGRNLQDAKEKKKGKWRPHATRHNQIFFTIFCR